MISSGRRMTNSPRGDRSDAQRQRRMEVRNLARELLRYHGQLSPPVPLRKLNCQPRELVIIEKDLRGACGGLLRWSPRGRRFYLYYDPDPYRHRFNLAHELAHYYIPQHCHAIRIGAGYHPSNSGEFSSNHRIEAEADCFASELLIPGFMLKDRGYEPCIEDAVAASTEFDTSLTCAAIKLVEYAEDPAAIICSKNGVIAWCWTNDELFERQVWGDRRGSRIPEQTPSSESWHTRQIAQKPRRVDSRRWFSTAPRDFYLWEEALTMPDHCITITMLSYSA
jgi:hypothetical protein